MKEIETDNNVVRKTPEEIKKGLQCHANNEYCKDGCPYLPSNHFGLITGVFECTSAILNDALALIEQLEEALLLMVYQYCSEDDGYVSHRCMTAGEHAFAALGIENYCSIETISKRLDEMEGIHKTPLPEPPKETEKDG